MKEVSRRRLLDLLSPCRGRVIRYRNLSGLRHLRATLANFTPRGRGNCVQQSVAMVMDVPTAKLKIGTVFDGHSYLHAWVEDRGIFYDPSRFEEDGHLNAFEPGRYIESQCISDIHTASRKWVLDFARRGSLSRWMLRDDDTHHTLGGIMGEVILQELGVPFSVDEEGFLLPTP